MSQLFSPEERRLVLLYLRPGALIQERSLWYLAYIVPSVLFAIYAVWRRDFVAALVAYVALLVPALMYLSYSGRYSKQFRSILEKYEGSVGALREP
jgi:predicted cobalt transporter CbtA